ncbi:hypothetical protein RhiirA4_492765 [Rhizophagus irregularis]|uniref:Uncharacterized protein n=1 Tax=Rhizophagus irregularis TaxID=588596 RepID=A0A2I1HXB4_9GLOM|nr:hypothetical protein RhiirA4_492765 [Rhizophagus irregularis]
MTILIAEDEARSAELVQAILLSYPFFVYSSEPFCLPDLFPTYRHFRLSLPKTLSCIVTILGYPYV